MDELYHARIFELAAGIPHIGALEAPQGFAEKLSRLCGSVVIVGLDLDADGRVSRFAIDPRACALGQASAGVLAANILGAPATEVIAARDALRAMLKQGAGPPQGRFWELRHLEGVRDYPARHASVMLAFEAAVAAIEQAQAKAPA